MDTQASRDFIKNLNAGEFDADSLHLRLIGRSCLDAGLEKVGDKLFKLSLLNMEVAREIEAAQRKIENDR